MGRLTAGSPRRLPTRLLAASCLAVAAALVPAAPALASSADPDWSRVAACPDPVPFDVVLDADGGFRAVDRARDIEVDGSVLDATLWQRGSLGDSVTELEIFGLQWLPSYLRALRAAADTARLDRLVVALGSVPEWRPDPGLLTDPVWKEGVNLRRQQNLNCVYDVTRDARLLPVVEATAAANLDPARYYGPPAYLPHNHGLMANLALLRAASLLDRPAWRDAAVARLADAVDAAFTTVGFTVEQSVEYHVENLGLWADAAAVLRAEGAADGLALVARIDAVAARATAVLQHLVAPDGRPVPIGDLQAARMRPVPRPGTAVVDRAAGLLAARWSWAAPDDYWVLRFGPRRDMHGHFDRMSVVWWAGGRPVVVDPGTASYSAGAARTWALSAVAHSAPVVRGRAFDVRAAVALRSYTHGSADVAVVTGSPYGVAMRRAVTVRPSLNRMTVVDASTLGLNQVWQLDPRWRLRTISATRTAATFTDGTGAVLTVVSTGRLATVVRGSAALGLAGGWTFGYPPPTATPATRIVVVGGTTVSTTFTVTGASLRPWAW